MKIKSVCLVPGLDLVHYTLACPFVGFQQVGTPERRSIQGAREENAKISAFRKETSNIGNGVRLSNSGVSGTAASMSLGAEHT